MNLKKLAITTTLVCLFSAGLGIQTIWAQGEHKTVTLSVNDIREVQVAFVIKAYRVGDPGVARVEQMSDRKLRVVGVKEGNTDLQVTGDGELTEMFKIAVGSSLDALLVQVRKDIDDIPGVEAETGLGKVVLRGTVTKPENWRQLKKLMRDYGDSVVSKVVFRIQDELLLKLKTDLEKAGFKVLERGKKAEEPGCVSLASSDNNILINGSVCSRGELEKINSIVGSYPWLKCKRDNAKDDGDDCYAVLNVSIAPVLLEVDVAFLGVTESEAQQIGANIAKNGLMFVDLAAQIFGKKGGSLHSSGSYVVGSTLSGTINAIAGSGPGRFKSIGHLTFKNDAADWKSFQDGGTINLPILGQNGGVGIQPIDYGLILKAKGGLANADDAALDLEVELSVPVIAGNSPAGPIYDLKRSRISSTILCPIGKTLILGGTKQLTEAINVTGTPILRDIPVLNFFFSQKNKSFNDRRVLILISPQIASAPTSAPPAVKETVGTIEDANKPLTTLGNKKSQK